MTAALLVIALVFVALAALRVGGAQRTLLMAHWPSVVLAVIAVLALLRGAYWPAAAMAGAAVLLWNVAPQRRAAPHLDMGDVEARTALGVGPDATSAEIRAAYRNKMQSAHPDRGGSHNEAARLAAARDRLLKGR